jgi:pimeloyl-ACP methyl ester carboxylesterase
VAEAGEGPPVLLLHGFPQFWWAWRHQLPALAAAGYRAIAMDLRGYGASDKPPRGYDTATLAADVSGVIRALGEREAVVVGHDWGGWVAWAMPSLAARVTRAVAVVSAAHPLELRRDMIRHPEPAAIRRLAAFQVPIRPERDLRGPDGVARVLREWGGAGYPDAEEARRYTRAMRLPFVAHTSMEYFRWGVRSVPRRDGRRFSRVVTDRIGVPVLVVQGARDPWNRPAAAVRSRAHAGGEYRYLLLEGVGHFVPEEAPQALTDALLGWLPDVWR